MPNRKCDVVVIGAGAAGLAAFSDLTRAGCDVICVEARDRIGGRVMTIEDPLCPIPIELGAEFVHGRPPEIWKLIRSARLQAYDCADSALRIVSGNICKDEDAWEMSGRVMDDMSRAAKAGPDKTFETFLRESPHSAEAKRMAASYVEGFNAARKEIIGIASLALDAEAADRIDGDHSFRIVNGYRAVLLALLSASDEPANRIHLDSPAEKVRWSKAGTVVDVRSALTGDMQAIECRKVVITAPLGVLQASPETSGAIAFDPEPAETLQAAHRLQFGNVFRAVLRFDEPFWEDMPDFTHAGFLLSDEPVFPTWWTALSVRAPILTGWSAGSNTDQLIGLPRCEVLKKAFKSLARILQKDAAEIQDRVRAAYFHDWHADPYSRGAYSYVPAGELPARTKLAEPVEGTLFFAGEATELHGHSATVHGAIASGRRAAKRVLDAFASGR